MAGIRVFLSRMNGWALSLLLHGGVAALAGLSVFSVQISGGSGKSAGGPGNGMVLDSFTATVHAGDETVVSGTVLPDVPQYSRLSSDEVTPEPISEQPAVPATPFDVFAVGASEPAPEPAVDPGADPTSFRPGQAEGRFTKLPPAQAGGQEGPSGSSGQGGSGGGNDAGSGNGEGNGMGDGAATGVYTPAPAYPTEARRRNIEGSVLLEFAIESDGSCQVRRVVQSSGFLPLDDAVQNAVRGWKYRPAADDGRPDITTKRIRFTFRLGQ